MKLSVVIHEAEEGGFWAEAVDLPGCCSQGETWAELYYNIREAAAAVLDLPTRVEIERGQACREQTTGLSSGRLVEIMI